MDQVAQFDALGRGGGGISSTTNTDLAVDARQGRKVVRRVPRRVGGFLAI